MIKALSYFKSCTSRGRRPCSIKIAALLVEASPKLVSAQQQSARSSLSSLVKMTLAITGAAALIFSKGGCGFPLIRLEVSAMFPETA